MRLFRLAVAACVAVLLLACSDDEGGREAFCRAASDTASFEAIFEDFDPDDVPGAIEAFRQARDAEIELRRDAPEEIRSDIDLLVQFLDDLVEGLEEVDPEAEGRPPVYDEMRTRFDQVEAASKRIEDYVTANCTTDASSG